VPLSEHEQKVLQAMEQALYAEDPRFATHITNHGLHPNKRRIIVGVLGVVIGLALVVLGALNGLIWLGAIGFALMVAGGAWAFSPAKKSVLGAVGPEGAFSFSPALVRNPQLRYRTGMPNCQTPNSQTATIAKPATSSMPIDVATAVKACRVAVQAAERPPWRLSSTRKTPSTKPIKAPTIGITKNPTTASTTARNIVDVRTPASLRRRPGTRYCVSTPAA
jgi:hypothetical protein